MMRNTLKRVMDSVLLIFMCFPAFADDHFEHCHVEVQAPIGTRIS